MLRRWLREGAGLGVSLGYMPVITIHRGTHSGEACGDGGQSRRSRSRRRLSQVLMRVCKSALGNRVGGSGSGVIDARVRGACTPQPPPPRLPHSHMQIVFVT